MVKKSVLLFACLAAASITFVSQKANAFTLATVAEGVMEPNPFTEPKLFEIEWRAGASDDRGDYEVAIGPNGATTTAAHPTFQVDWHNGVPVPWTISFQAASGKATLEIFNQTTTYDTNFKNYIWDKLGLFAIVKNRGDGLIEDGTKIELWMTSINGDSNIHLANTWDQTPGTSAMFDSTQSPVQTTFSRYFSSGSTPITQITGMVTLSWNTADPQPWNRGARSSIDLRLMAIESPPELTNIPEPSGILGLLSVGLLGLSIGLKNKL